MSPKEEVHQLNEQVLAAAAKGDFASFVNALDDDVEVFDHVPYLFEGKGRFLAFANGPSRSALQKERPDAGRGRS
jgi:ketosteroid isomerase-like protein